MSLIIPSIPWSVTVPVVATAAALPVWAVFVVYRGARRLGRSARAAAVLSTQVGTATVVWALAAVALSALGVFRDGPDAVPWVLIWFVGVVVLGTVGVARWTELSTVLAHRQTLAELLLCQTARWLGAVFLALHLGGQLPGFFAFPAGFGDILVGLTCLFAVVSLAWGRSNKIPIAWTLLGLLDFVVAVGTAAAATQAIHLVTTNPPTSVITVLPMVLFPAYLVPFSAVLHLTTLRLLLRSRPAHRIPGPIEVQAPA